MHVAKGGTSKNEAGEGSKTCLRGFTGTPKATGDPWRVLSRGRRVDSECVKRGWRS